MTNTEYEKASITAANPEAALARADEVIASIEAALAVAQEARREIINRYGLNKPPEESPLAKMAALMRETGPTNECDMPNRYGTNKPCEHKWRFGSANKLQEQKQCVLCGRVELVR